MSATLSMGKDATLFVASTQDLTTNYEADQIFALRHDRRMLSHDELLAKLRQMKADGLTTNADLARILRLPTPRIADIFATDRTPRKVTVDEMKTLVEHFELQELPPEVADILLKMGERDQRRAISILKSLAAEHDPGEAAG